MPGDAALLSLITDHFQTAGQVGAIKQPSSMQVEPVAVHALVNALRSEVPQYRDASIELDTIELAQTRPLTAHLERFKFRRLNLLESLHRYAGLPSAAIIVGSPWPITPPVIEVTPDGSMVIMDGTHRTFAAIPRGDDTINALIVRGATDRLPATPHESWERVRCYDTKLPRERRYRGFEPANFRPIRKAFRTLAERA
jgi:hypothetical protein